MRQRINMDLDEGLWKQVGIRAIELGIQKRELVERALKEFLGEQGQQEAKTMTSQLGGKKMFDNNDWAELITDLYDELTVHAAELYDMACDGPEGIRYTLTLWDDGDITLNEHVGRSQLAAVHDGEAISVLSLESFDPVDGDPMDWFPHDAGLPDLDEFLDWAKDHAEEPDEPTLSDYEEFNEDGYLAFRRQYARDYVKATVDDWVSEQLRLRIAILRGEI